MRYICLILGATLSAGAAPAATAGDSGAVRSVVRVDRNTGRLVRTILVPKNYLSSLSPAAAPAAGAPQPPSALEKLVDETARTHGVDPALVHSIISVESNYNPFAVSPKGAEGLMQLIPGTARRFGVSNSFDPRQNVAAGVKYLKYLQELYQGDLRLALAAYNAGEGAVARYRDVPPYRETEGYVYKVGRKLRAARAREQAKKPVAAAKPQEHAELVAYRDNEGRLHLRTR
ncbi:MAG: lytic transglycosylase domain-containing protein [Bryobacteraceae bacterium]|nr:lytic transglycosylase domain-containing protein [Bryobacteraceae bacterium]